MKSLAEKAKGQPGVWTAEYESRLAAIKQREAASAQAMKGCLIVFAIFAALGAVGLGACGIAVALAPAPTKPTITSKPPAPPTPTQPRKR